VASRPLRGVAPAPWRRARSVASRPLRGVAPAPRRRACSVASRPLGGVAPAPMDALKDLSAENYVNRGLNQLGLHDDSHLGVLHLWARRLPRGMLDGHRSSLAAPDHLVFHGLTKRVLSGVFKLLDRPQRARAAASFRDALRHSHLTSTTVYKVKRSSIVSLSISELAATLTVASFVFRRELKSASSGADGTVTPLLAGMKVLDAFTTLVNALYYYPRISLDGAAACKQRTRPEKLRHLDAEFFRLVCAACLRGDTAAFGHHLDVPNLHRLRELLEFVVPAILHLRHIQELLFENAHQPSKRAVVTGNGHDDAGRAFERTQQAEFISRLALQPSFFNIDNEWLDDKGLQAQLKAAKPLFSMPSGRWRCCGAKVEGGDVPPPAGVNCMKHWSSSDDTLRWKRRATRGDAGRIEIGDAVAVLVRRRPGVMAVNIARGQHVLDDDCRLSFFRVEGICNAPQGVAAAVVRPILPIVNSEDFRIAAGPYQYLALDDGVRRALLLHSCAGECNAANDQVRHTQTNRWRVFSRKTGYPSRSG